MIKKPFALAGMMLASAAHAQLSNNLSIGNPVSIALAHAVTANPPGTDAIHFNPAGLAQIRQELTRYKLALAHTEFDGTVSGQAPGEPYGVPPGGPYSQDPLLRGQMSRNIDTSSANVYLPFVGHLELPVGIAPGIGSAIRSENGKFVFANSALMVAAGGFRRDPDNVAAYSGEKVGQTTLAYFNPTLAFSLTDELDIGVSAGFTWVGLGIQTQVRSVVQSLGMVNELVGAIDPSGSLGISISPYSDVGWLEMEMDDPMVVTGTIGLLWRPQPWLSLGLTYKSQGKARLSGEYEVRYKDDFLATLQTLEPASGAFHLLEGTRLQAQRVQSGWVKTELTTPQSLSAGVSMQVTSDLRVNLDVRWLDYSVIGQVDTFYENPLDYLTVASMVNTLFKDRVDGFDWADPRVMRTRRNYEDVVDWSLGFEYQYSETLTLRWGVEPRTSPISETWMEPTQPLGDAWYFGAGFGVALNDNGRFDFGLGYMKSDITLEPGESRVANSMTEGETNSLFYRGMRIEHTLETYVISIGYTKEI